jgi:hypothetical protein
VLERDISVYPCGLKVAGQAALCLDGHVLLCVRGANAVDGSAGTTPEREGSVKTCSIQILLSVSRGLGFI